MKVPEIYLLGGSLNSLTIPKTTSIEQLKVGAIGINADLVLCEYNGSKWNTLVDTTEDLFPFTTHTFLGISSDYTVGPTISQCASAYINKPFMSDLTLFNCTGGIQIWTVPATGTYRIVSRGGSNFNVGGSVDITTVLVKGDKLRMIVGRTSSTYAARYLNGCGASVVYSDSLGLLSIAGGAGGSGGTGSIPDRSTEVTVDAPGSGLGGSARSYGSSSSGVIGGGGSGYKQAGGYNNPYSPGVGKAANLIDPTVTNCAIPGTGSYRKDTQNSYWTVGTPGGFGGGGGSAGWSVYAYQAAAGGGGGYTGGSSYSGYSSNPVDVSAQSGTNYTRAGLISRNAIKPPRYTDGEITITRLS